MQTLTNIDLREDSAASWYVKDETVQVVFATEAGELISREGPNRYQRGAVFADINGDGATSRCQCWRRKCRTRSPLRGRQVGMC